MSLSFREEILSLIHGKHEGEYWDFKCQWHDKSKPADLLFDIICLANNTAWRDAYIIIGVDEAKDYQLVDITNDANRRNTQGIVCFLRDKQFAAGIRPEVEVRPISFAPELVIDVIVIKATRHTPYYLVKDWSGIRAHHIYSRVMDSNTDRDKSADPHIVEQLWANRFALNASAMDRARQLLQSPEKWESEPILGNGYFHSIYPEFTVRYTHDETKNSHEYYLFSQINHTPNWYEINLQYHQTILFSCIGASLDSGAFFVPCPEMEFLYRHGPSHYGFSCYTKGTMEYLLYEFFLAKEPKTMHSVVPRMRFLECIPVFESEDEKKYFLDYAEHHAHNYVKKEYRLPLFSKENECYADHYRSALMVQDMLHDYRQEVNHHENGYSDTLSHP